MHPAAWSQPPPPPMNIGTRWTELGVCVGSKTRREASGARFPGSFLISKTTPTHYHSLLPFRWTQRPDQNKDVQRARMASVEPWSPHSGRKKRKLRPPLGSMAAWHSYLLHPSTIPFPLLLCRKGSGPWFLPLWLGDNWQKLQHKGFLLDFRKSGLSVRTLRHGDRRGSSMIL
jgi:hypothetical protein